MRVIQCYYGDIPEVLNPCLDSVFRVHPQVELFRFPASPTPIYESDKWRWNMMLENDDILYLDCDIILTEPLIFLRDLPSMIFHERQPDNCLMYSPDRRHFQKYEAERIRRGITMETLAWYRKVLRDKPINEVIGIKHLRNSGKKKLLEQYSLLQNNK